MLYKTILCQKYYICHVVNKTRDCETQMPRGNKVKIWQNIEVLMFYPAPPPVASDISEV